MSGLSQHRVGAPTALTLIECSTGLYAAFFVNTQLLPRRWWRPTSQVDSK
jgi:hypothetical protein